MNMRARDKRTRVGEGEAVSGLPHRWANVVVTCVAGSAALYLFTLGAWAPGARTSAWVFTLFALGPWVLRALQSWWPTSRLLVTAEAFWLMPVVAIGHGFLGPVVDAFGSPLMDQQLAQADLRLFGMAPSVVLGALSPPWLTELLLLCYYSYFLWPAALGVLLWARGQRAEFGQFAFALALFFSVNYLGYVLVPAVGPRFYLSGWFAGPLQGLYLVPLLDGLMRMPAFIRDCFPSGHTGVTLVVLAFAWRFERRFFNVMLLPASGLILATLVGRFHYGVDLLCALPLVLTVLSVATTLVRVEPQSLPAPRRARVALGRREQPA